MSGREKNILARDTTEGIVYMSCSFMTAGTSNPTVYSDWSPPIYLASGNTARGEGMAGSYNAGLNPSTGVTRLAAGAYSVKLDWGHYYRYVITKYADLEDYALGSDDGSYATITAAANEGTLTPLTFTVFTRVVGGTKTDFGPGGTGAARRISINLALKDTNAGK
jgi:hypothetical protein